MACGRFRLPLAIDSSTCLRCGVCAGYICPTGARSSSAQLLERAIAEGLPIKIQTQVEVERLVREPRHRNHADRRARPDFAGRRRPTTVPAAMLWARRDRIVASPAALRAGRAR